MWQYNCVGSCDTVIISSLVSIAFFNCIVQNSLYHNMDICTFWHYALVSCNTSQSIGLVFGCALFWRWVSLCVPCTYSLIEGYFIVTIATIIGIFHVLWIYWPTHLCFVKLGRSGSATITSLAVSAPGHFLWMLDWACYTFGLLCVMFRFFTRIFYRGVPGFATDCPCSVWCCGLTTYLLYGGPLFGSLVWNDSGFLYLKWWKETFFIVFNYVFTYVFTYILMSHKKIPFYFHPFYFHVLYFCKVLWYCPFI